MTTLKITMINKKSDKVEFTKEVKVENINIALKKIEKIDKQLLKQIYYFKYEINTK